MYFNQIHYELSCRNCKSVRLPGMTMLRCENEDEVYSREELLEIMENFVEITCDNCGVVGDWLCFKIYLNDDDDVRSQLKINIFKEDDKLWGKPEDGMFSPAEFEIAIMDIREKIEMEKYNYYPPRQNGTAFIIIDFINDDPYSRVAAFDLDGITVDEVSEFIDAMVGRGAPETLSPELTKRLEAAYEDLIKDTINPLELLTLKTVTIWLMYILLLKIQKKIHYSV